MQLVAYNLRMGGSAAHWRALDGAFAPELVLAQESAAPPPSTNGGAVHWRPVPGHRWGSALFLRSGTVEPVPVRGFDGWVVAADVHGLAPAPLRVVSLHVPAGRGGYIAVAQRILDRLARGCRGRAFLIGGDFNMTCGRRLEGEERKNEPAQLALLERLEGEFGLVNAWQLANPDRPLAQTLRWTANPVTPYHCDGIFLPRAWAGAVLAAEVVAGGEWDRLSDHNPVVVRLLEPWPHAATASATAGAG